MGCTQSAKDAESSNVVSDAEIYRDFLSEKVATLQKQLTNPDVPSSKADRFQIIGRIGRGSFCDVFEVRHRESNIRYALKVLEKRRVMSHPGLTEQVLIEKNIHAALDFEFIIKLRFAFKDNTSLYFVFELATCGNLYNLLKEQTLNEDEVRFYTAQLVLALEYIHGGDIIYRDLKPDNILISCDGYIKLTDFGLAKRLDDNKRAYSLCGDAEYMAPEVAVADGCKGYGVSADWWSLGILVYYVLFSVTPFLGCSAAGTIHAVMYDPFRIPNSIKLSRRLTHFLCEVLQKQPERRLGTRAKGPQGLKDHPWLSSFEWMTLYKKQYIPPVAYPKLRRAKKTSWKPAFSSTMLHQGDFKDF